MIKVVLIPLGITKIFSNDTSLSASPMFFRVNVLGTINPVKDQFYSTAHAWVPVMIDGAQSTASLT